MRCLSLRINTERLSPTNIQKQINKLVDEKADMGAFHFGL